MKVKIYKPMPGFSSQNTFERTYEASTDNDAILKAELIIERNGLIGRHYIETESGSRFSVNLK